jgi:single-stranded-DNA-specific exonuclease
MSAKTRGSPSLKSLKKQCSEIRFTNHEQVLLVSSPDTSSTLATAVLCRAILKSGGMFHVTFESPIISIERVNELRAKYESASVIFVGVDTTGKKKLRKGKSYPLFIGGISESPQIQSQTLGTYDTVPATAFVFVEEYLTSNDYELQIAAAATLLHTGLEKLSPKVNKEIVESAKEDKLIEERKGIKLFGFGFLPLDELFIYSTRPFIQGMSGNQQACDALLNEADIPLPKLRSPMSDLNNKEAQHFTQHLTSRLLEKIGPNIIPHILGTDYILTLESETNPLRYLSGLEAIAETTWARQEQGAAMSVWIGDRGRSLRNIIDTYLSHHKDVISTILRLETKLKGVSTETSTIIEIAGVQGEILTDVGRVALQSGLANQERPLLVVGDKSTIVTWTSESINTNQVLQVLQQKNLDPVLTSAKSIKFEDLPIESREDVLASITTNSKKA